MHIGLSEIIVIAIFAVALVKPSKLPEYAAKISSLLASLKENANALGSAMEPLRESMSSVKEMSDDINKQLSDIKDGALKGGKE